MLFSRFFGCKNYAGNIYGDAKRNQWIQHLGKKKSFTGLAEILCINDKKVFPVIGDKENIKITTPFDLVLAELRLSGAE